MKRTMPKLLKVIALCLLITFSGCSTEDIETFSNVISVLTDEHTETTNVSTNEELGGLTFDGTNQVIILHHNRTTFTEEDLSLENGSWQSFSDLDRFNRVGVANAMLSKSLMPKEKREPLYVDPTGWKNKKYTVNGKTEWLYNRCHLIGFQLTGENNNLKNLMTGTNSLNNPGMLKYENMVAEYLKETGHHVRYQVEPIFKENELVARGVHMQAKSIEDNELEFNIYIFNVEERIVINYEDGTSRKGD